MTQNKLIKTIKSLFVQEVNADERAMTIGDTSRQLTTQEHNPASKLNVDNTYHVIKNAFHQNNLEIRKNAAQQVTLAKKIAAGYVIPGSTAILCDTSYSMQIPNETGRKRIDLLHQAIDLLAKK